MEEKTPRIIPLQIRAVQQLAAIYMPFLRNGGLFIPSPKPPRMGEEIAFLLTLPGRSEPLKVLGRVVWINPPGGTFRPGFGVQFDEQDKGETRRAIETLLGPLLLEETQKLYF